MILTKEEKAILLIILISLVIGSFIYFLTSYKSKIKKVNISTRQICLNLNTATIDDLDRIPGIGKIIAQRIIEYREKNNGFKKIDELKDIKGINAKKLEKIKKYIKVE